MTRHNKNHRVSQSLTSVTSQEILEPEERLPAPTSRPGNIFIGRLKVVIQPLVNHRRYYRESKLHLWTDIGVAITIVALVGLSIYAGLWQPKPQLEFSATYADGEIVAGQPQDIILSYKNIGQELDQVELVLVPPKQYRLLTVEPKDNFNNQTNTFNLGHLAHNANGRIILTGELWQSLHSSTSFVYTFNTQRKNRSESLFFSQPLIAARSIAAFEAKIPEKIYTPTFAVKGKINNTDGVDLQNIELAANDGWKLVEASTGQPLEQFALTAGQTRDLDLLALPTKKTHPNQLVIGVWAKAANNGRLLLAEWSATLNLKQPRIVLNLEKDGNSVTPSVLEKYTLTLQNDEDLTLTDIRLQLGTDNQNVRLVALRSGDEASQATNYRELTLAELKPSSINTANVWLAFAPTGKQTGQSFAITGNLSALLDGQNISYDFTGSKLNLSSLVQAYSVANYYSRQGDQLGIGPLPPIVGIPTRFWIFWQIDNAGNDLESARMNAILPAGVTYTGKTTLLAGDLTFDTAARSVNWTVGQISGQGGEYRAGFEVEITPNEKQVGTTLNLLNTTHLKATDRFTGEKITRDLAGLSTNLDFDPLARGKGRVER